MPLLLTFDFGQIRLFTFVIVLLISFGLSLLLARHSRKSIPHRFFLLFLIAQSLWLVVMYMSLEVSKDYLLLMARVSLFFGTFDALLLFLFVYALKKHKIDRKFLLFLSTVAIAVAGLSLSPLTFTHLEPNAVGELAPKAGIGIIAFTLFTGFCTLGASYIPIKQYIFSRGIEKTHWGYIAIGVIATYFLVMFFDVFYYNTTGNLNVVRLNHLYVLPFLLSASYVLLKHHFLNIRVLATELFAFSMVGISVVQITFARNFTEFVFSSILFVLLVFFSVLLIRSMGREIKHRVQEVAYEELRKLDAAKSEFITIASHQLRTPLSGLKGYISMAQEGSYGKLPGEMMRVLGNMGQATERLISLADSFLNVSRMQAGKVDLQKEEVQIEELIENAAEELRPRAKEKGLRFAYIRPKNTLPRLFIDKEKIHMVLASILDNAIRYTAKGSIAISLKAQGSKLKNRSLVISIGDTGKGLTQEEIKDAFTSFKRGKTAQSLWTEGVGLSLYIAKQFVEAHGGKIWAESAGTGQGSVFFVELPIDSQ